MCMHARTRMHACMDGHACMHGHAWWSPLYTVLALTMSAWRILCPPRCTCCCPAAPVRAVSLVLWTCPTPALRSRSPSPSLTKTVRGQQRCTVWGSFCIMKCLRLDRCIVCMKKAVCPGCGQLGTRHDTQQTLIHTTTNTHTHNDTNSNSQCAPRRAGPPPARASCATHRWALHLQLTGSTLPPAALPCPAPADAAACMHMWAQLHAHVHASVAQVS